MSYLHDSDFRGYFLKYRGTLMFVPEHLVQDYIDVSVGYTMPSVPHKKIGDDEFQAKLGALHVLV